MKFNKWSVKDPKAEGWGEAAASWFFHEGEWLQCYGQPLPNVDGDPSLFEMATIFFDCPLAGEVNKSYCPDFPDNSNCTGNYTEILDNAGNVLFNSTSPWGDWFWVTQPQSWTIEVSGITPNDFGLIISSSAGLGGRRDYSALTWEARNSEGVWIARGNVRNFEYSKPCVLQTTLLNPDLGSPGGNAVTVYEWGCDPTIRTIDYPAD